MGQWWLIRENLTTTVLYRFSLCKLWYGIVQDSGISSANALEIPQSCTKPMWYVVWLHNQAVFHNFYLSLFCQFDKFTKVGAMGANKGRHNACCLVFTVVALFLCKAPWTYLEYQKQFSNLWNSIKCCYKKLPKSCYSRDRNYRKICNPRINLWC